MLNIAETGYASDSASEPESADPEETEETDDYIDYEVVSETLDTGQTFMRTTTSYDNTGNYVVTENDESGAQKFYTYDVMVSRAVGDVNKDGFVNIIDATLVQKYIVDPTKAPASEKKSTTRWDFRIEQNIIMMGFSDMNLDNKRDITDVTCIQKKIAKLPFERNYQV